MEVPLRKTYEATPAPKLVVAVADCAKTCGVFKGGAHARAGGAFSRRRALTLIELERTREMIE